MPEGPEVHQKAKWLREQITDKVLLNVNAVRPNSIVLGIGVKGKKLWLILKNRWSVLFSFGLDGDLVIGSEVEIANIISILAFEGGLQLVLTDPMRIARVEYVSNVEEHLPTGTDPIIELIGMREWIEICRHNEGKTVATLITDQDVIAGVGNRYRSEILYLAKLDPIRRVIDLTDQDLEVLLVSIYRILNAASRGEFEFAVYGKSLDPYGKPVVKVEVLKGVHVWTVKERYKVDKPPLRKAEKGKKPVKKPKASAVFDSDS